MSDSPPVNEAAAPDPAPLTEIPAGTTTVVFPLAPGIFCVSVIDVSFVQVSGVRVICSAPILMACVSPICIA